MRWDDLDSATKSAAALITALVSLGLIATGLSFQLQERWPLLVFFVALFGVVLFLVGVSAWQRLTEPKQANLSGFKRASLFQLQPGRQQFAGSAWTVARDLCLLAAVIALAGFVIHSFSIGGDALRGYAAGGKYFVRLHTTVTEVSAEQWRLNWRLGLAVFTLLPLAVAVTVVAVYKERHDRFHYRDMDRL